MIINLTYLKLKKLVDENAEIIAEFKIEDDKILNKAISQIHLIINK